MLLFGFFLGVGAEINWITKEKWEAMVVETMSKVMEKLQGIEKCLTMTCPLLRMS